MEKSIYSSHPSGHPDNTILAEPQDGLVTDPGFVARLQQQASAGSGYEPIPKGPTAGELVRVQRH